MGWSVSTPPRRTRSQKPESLPNSTVETETSVPRRAADERLESTGVVYGGKLVVGLWSLWEGGGRGKGAHGHRPATASTQIGRDRAVRRSGD